MRPIVRILLAGLLAIAGPAARAADLATMSPSEIESLQHRLTDAGCYAGPIDGRPSPATGWAADACPSQEPVLRIETGMHTAVFKRMDLDARCTLMATGSEDKTVRLWSMPEGRLIRTIRLPIAPLGGGVVHAVALSPDGTTLAAAGSDAALSKGRGHGVYLVDLRSGAVRRLGTSSAPINALAFSPDGNKIAAAGGLAQSGGVHVFDRASGRDVMADLSYRDAAYGVAFGADGALFTTSDDGKVRRYDPDLRLSATVGTPVGAHPADIKLDPSGTRVAVGDEDVAAVTILDAATLRVVATGDTNGIGAGTLSTLAWTADGTTLLAAGSARASLDRNARAFVRAFDPAGRHVGRDVPVSDDTIYGLKACGRDIVFGAANPTFGTIDQDGDVRVLQGPPIIDARAALVRRDSFRVSADATSVRFALDLAGTHPVRFDLAAGTLTDATGPDADLAGPATAGLPVTDWVTRPDPKFDGKPLAMDPYERSQSLAIRPARDGFVLGTGWFLRAYARDATLRWKVKTDGAADGVGLSADGRVVVAADDDGTIRWHRWSDGAELLALFVDARTRRWVAWTPTGYYMASPGGEDLIGWHVNRGWQQEADFFPASRLRDRFSRPDIVRLILATQDESEAVRQADAAARRHEDQVPVIQDLPPVIRIVEPADGSAVAEGSVAVRFLVRSPSGDRIDRVESFVDGVKVEARGLGPAAAPGQEGTVTVPMPAHDAVVSLVAYAGGRAGEAASVRLTGVRPADGTPSPADALKPTLYALLVGVATYDNPSFNLGFAARDATGLAAALMGQKGKLYKDVEVKVLTDKDATSTGMKRGLLWLQKQMTARDLAIVFAAGHGMTDAKGRFWFLTADADPDALTVSAVSQDDMSSILFDLPGKKLLFLDACHSGAALNQGARAAGGGATDVSAALNDFGRTEGGVVAYSASTGREFSFERQDWGHGAFTMALIEGIGEGKADITHSGTITTATLDYWLETRVKQLTDGRQHPEMTRPRIVPDFPIALP